MVEKIDELNGIIERNAGRNGFLFANPNPRFDGHELCSGGTEWIYPLLSPSRIPPTLEGQQAVADAVLATLDAGGFQKFTVHPQQKVTYSFVAGSGKQFISLITGWPGSDVSLTVVSPRGRQIGRNTQASDVSRVTGATSELVEVVTPEPGTWTAELFGVDVAPAGEETTLSVYQSDPENQRPVGQITSRVVGNSLVLDWSTSADSDGKITSYDWYVTAPTGDDVKQGASITVPLTAASERTFTLVVTDDRGATDFSDLAWVSTDVMPGSLVNPIKLTSKGVTPIALRSTPNFDATTVARKTIRVGPGAAPVKETTAVKEDVDGDGRLGQVVHEVTTGLGLTLQSTQLCLSMTLPNGRAASSCNRIRAQ